MAISTIFTTTLGSSSGGNSGFTFANKYTTAAFSLPAGTIARVRCTFEAGSGEGLKIAKAYVGHGAGSGDVYDFADTPVQMLFSGAASTTISASGTQATDWATFAYNKTSALVISWYCDDSANDTTGYKTSEPTGSESYFYSLADQAATVNKTTGYGHNTNEYYSIISIEVDTVESNFFLLF